SNGLAAKFGKSSVWSVSCIDRSTTPPTVSSQFMGLLGTVAPPSATPGLVTGTVTSNPVVTVTHVDSGTNPP
ncbi:MAG: hypothetical protein RQ966_01645, partial [Acetobacteraceae bacterium]|nr:hypothetical protein [Acetobacteraceae bacterium]